MNYKKSLAIFLFIALIIIAGVLLFRYKKSVLQIEQKADNPLVVQDKTITDNTNPFKINITYPEIAGLDDFNQKAKAIVDKELNTFKTNSLENDQAVKDTDPENYAKYPREYELDISYEKGEINNDLISIIFNVYNFEGGAHGASYFVPLNYNVETKKEIKLMDLFPNDENYLQKISDFCVEDLTSQLTKSGGIEMTEASWIQRGAGPTEENFQLFLIDSDNTIIFYFPQYQVAAYAAGNFKVVMPK